MQTLQLYAYDQSGVRWELDLYEDDPIKITISAEDIIDIPRIDASFSRQFRIPATQNNSRFFKYWWTSGVVDFDVTKKVAGEIYVDGLIYRTGQLRLEAAYVNEDTSQIDFEIVFLGETKDFASQVSEGFLRDLNLDEGFHDLSTATLPDTWRAFGDPLLPLNGAYRYILAQRGYTYDGGVQYPDHEISTETGGGLKTFVNPTHPMWVTQFTPIIQVKYLIDKIFANTTYTYSSDSVFNELWFQDLYTDGLPDASPEVTAQSLKFEANIGEPYEFPGGGTEILMADTVVSNDASAYNPSTYIFTSGSDSAAYAFASNVTMFDRRSDTGSAGRVDLNLWRKEVGSPASIVATAFNTGTSGTPFSQYSVSVSLTYSNTVLPGTQFWVEIESSGQTEQPFLEEGVFECTTAPSQVALSALLKDDVKQIDFFRSILTKFRLVMVPSKETTNEFIIKPWKDYVAKGDLFDWTYKLDYSRDVVLKPVFFSQSATINFTDQEDSDSNNYKFQDQEDHVYGRFLFNSSNDLIGETREVNTIFAPTPVDVIIGDTAGSPFIIPSFAANGTEVDPNHNHIQLIPMRPKPRLLFWNGMKTTGGTTWYYDDAPGGAATSISMTTYPCATPYSDFLTTPTTLNLNWNIEADFVGEILGESVYTRYWNSYIQELYSSEARIMTAYFKIDAQDLRDLTFDDVIFIKDTYWRVQKIYDAPLTDIDVVKVDLIKLVSYIPTPYAGPYTAEDLWGVSDDTYEDADGPWLSPESLSLEPGDGGMTGGGGDPGEEPSEPVDGGGNETPVLGYTVLDAEANFALLRTANQYSTTPTSGQSGYYTGYWINLDLRNPTTNLSISKTAFQAGGVIEFTNLTNNGSGNYTFFAKLANNNSDTIFVKNGTYAQIYAYHIINNTTGAPLTVDRTLSLFRNTANTEVRLYAPGAHPSGLS